jgi:hypothetical protein
MVSHYIRIEIFRAVVGELVRSILAVFAQFAHPFRFVNVR